MIQSRWRPRFRKLLALTPREFSELLWAQTALLRAQRLVSTRPVGELIAAGEMPPPGAAGQNRMPDMETASRLALAVQRAAKHGVFRPLCLVQAVALNQMLEARGISGSQIKVGVRLQSGRFAAHAWVELDQRVLGDRETNVRRFEPLTDLQLLTRR